MKKPTFSDLEDIAEGINDGFIKIPKFQREFVWTPKKSAALLDSIIKGYPIGSFIIWKTNEEKLSAIRDFGDVKLPPTPKGEKTKYVLDGQQRIITLFASQRGLTVPRRKGKTVFSKLFVDLSVKNEKDENIVIPPQDREEGRIYISFRDLMENNHQKAFRYKSGKANRNIDDERKDEVKDRVAEYSKRAIKFPIPWVVVDGPIEVATEVFTRVNTQGKRLDIFEIMVAKTFNQSRNFDLAEKFKEFDAESSKSGYEIKPKTLLQIMAILLGGEKAQAKDRDILSLDNGKFIDEWEKAVDALKRSIYLFRQKFGIPASIFLPSDELLIPFAYFFYHHPKEPSGNETKYLQDLFWRAACLLWQVHLGGTDQIQHNRDTVNGILDGGTPNYRNGVDISPQYIERSGVNKSLTGRYAKTMLCLFASMKPEEFRNGIPLSLDGSSLSPSNKHNLHHFFPKDFLRKKKISKEMVSHVANITIISSDTNKEIGPNPPSIYMEQYNKDNSRLNKTMATHLIDLSWDAIKEKNYDEFMKNYDKFITKRCEWISKELNKRIERQEKIDGQNALPSSDEEEEDKDEQGSMTD